MRSLLHPFGKGLYNFGLYLVSHFTLCRPCYLKRGETRGAICIGEIVNHRSEPRLLCWRFYLHESPFARMKEDPPKNELLMLLLLFSLSSFIGLCGLKIYSIIASVPSIKVSSLPLCGL